MRNKFIFLILYFLLINGLVIYPQQIITSGGDSHQNSSGSINYTIGEVVIETYSQTSNILTQGFNQPSLVTVAISQLKGLDFEISAFPNPTKEFIKLKINSDKMTGMKYQLFDLNGKLIQNKILENTETEVSLSNYSPATYFIKVFEGKNELKTFKIVKQ